MSQKKLVNLTLFIVKEELENYKLTSCNLQKQEILADPELVKEILAYVLSRIPNIYTVVATEKVREKYQNKGKSLEQRIRIERLIERAIKSILERQFDRNRPILIYSQN